MPQVKDFRNDVILAEACRQDVDIHCSEVTPGDGKVHKCLVDHQDQLTAACRAETNHLSMTTATNVELNPSLGRACAPEMKAHCRGVTPGKARVLNCLLANADKVLAGHGGVAADVGCCLPDRYRDACKFHSVACITPVC